ncbi:MAG: acyl-CoA dehydrogenase family protein [Bacteriovorax sp.]|nr:acyl-CoA dehydrogenase family protein [Bacteriovorax sp.]
MKDFVQTMPILINQFDDDKLLKSFLTIKIPEEYQKEIFANLSAFGQRVIEDISLMAKDAEENPPQLIQFDCWGNRIDDIKTSRGWKDLHRVSAEEEIVRIGYDKNFAQYSRMIQFSKLYLFHPSSAFYSCPLAMTDGAAKLIELYGNEQLKLKAFLHLTSNDPEKFWTSAQWMTEKSGGSDVSATETVARKIDGKWKLFGTKWFCSAITAHMALALARTEDEAGQTIAGSKGLSLFYIELRKDTGELNHFEIIRLKEKLGTNALPTAEIKLNGTDAELIGIEGEGVKLISSMFNITRLYNAVTAIGAFRRVLTLAKDYSGKRKAFKKLINQHPLNIRILAKAQVDFHACFHLTFLISEIIGSEEVFTKDNSLNLNQEELSKILRLLTPIVKLYTAKKVVIWTSELLEVFAGVGYIENSGISRLYRDNQVFSIWEGTTNVLSLDLLRALRKDNSFSIFKKMIFQKLELIKTSVLRAEVKKVFMAIEEVERIFEQKMKADESELEGISRDLAFSIGNITAATGMLEHAAHENSSKNAITVVKIFSERNLCQIETFDQEKLESFQDVIA